MRITCPTCRRVLDQDQATLPDRPFCSARCRMADLGSWLNGNYRIATTSADEEDDEGSARSASDSDDRSDTN
jgi:endogenous inhibitor of DNA gyrase (YacG/DUF329 family)